MKVSYIAHFTSTQETKSHLYLNTSFFPTKQKQQDGTEVGTTAADGINIGQECEQSVT